MEGGWEWSPAFWHHAVFCTLFSCSCLLSIHSTIQSSNISVATCLWHFWFEEWGALLLLRLFSWFQNHFAHSTFFLSFMFLLCISAMHMSALVLNWFILFWILIFLLIVMALVYCFSFASQQTASLTLWMIQLHHYFFSWCQSLLLFLIDFGVSLAISWSYYALPLWCNSFVCLVSFPSFLTFPTLFFTLWALYQYLCIVCYTFNNYLTTLFDVYCMLSQSICCTRNLPTKCILHLASHLYQYV